MSPEPPWMNAWLEAQAALAVAGATQTTELHAKLVDGYRRLFLPADALAAVAAPVGAGAAAEQYRLALQGFAQIAAAVAVDAGRRLSEELAREGPDAPPITSLRELQALWIECGEAAWAAAARRDDFAEAQAELLAALVELRAAARSA